MNNWECKHKFKSTKGIIFEREDIISDDEYNQLMSDECYNFEPTDEEVSKKKSSTRSSSRKNDEDSFYGQSGNIAMGDMLGTGIPGGMDMDFSTPI